MKTIILCLLLLFITNNYAQGYFNNWYFGEHAGITFNTGVPTATSGSLSTIEGCASISDFSGKILFYTNGINVWNANHAQMPNGAGLAGDESSTQSALIVPNPGNRHQYYIFTTPAGNIPLSYSLVDITLDKGFGDVTIKNTALHASSTERATAIATADGKGFWIVGHERENNRFFAYQLTAAGLSASPVISGVGSEHTNFDGYIGYLKPSHNRNKLAVAILHSDLVEVFDFNPSTGMLSNPLTFSSFTSPYGIEFSADDSRLYVSGGNTEAYIYQVDMHAGGDSAVVKSALLITKASNTAEIGALQLGPDDKLYIAQNGLNSLSLIENPNALGPLCNYQANRINLGAGLCRFGLPNFFELARCAEPVINFDHRLTLCEGESLTLNGGTAQTYLWSDGSTNAALTVDTPGKYWLQASNGFCKSSDTVFIVSDCKVEVKFPNVFTPNNDGINDNFIPMTYTGNPQLDLKIYNKWGKEVFYTDNLSNGWNGKYENNACSDGTYFWTAHYKNKDNEAVYLKGFVTLLR